MTFARDTEASAFPSRGVAVLVKELLLLLLSRFSRVDSVRPHRWQPTRLHHPWDSSGKTTGVGCHFLLQCMKVKSESEDAQSCPTLHDPIDCSLPGSSAHGIFQARVLLSFNTMQILEHFPYSLTLKSQEVTESEQPLLILLHFYKHLIHLILSIPPHPRLC